MASTRVPIAGLSILTCTVSPQSTVPAAFVKPPPFIEYSAEASPEILIGAPGVIPLIVTVLELVDTPAAEANRVLNLYLFGEVSLDGDGRATPSTRMHRTRWLLCLFSYAPVLLT